MSTVRVDQYEAIAYVCTGADIALTMISLFHCYRVFKVKSKALLFCLWGITAQLCSTIVTFTGGYFVPELGAELTTLDGCLYVQMVVATFFAYKERVVTLQKQPHLDKYARYIPYGIIVLMIPDVIGYILSAWEDKLSEDMVKVSQDFSNVMFYIVQTVYLLANFALYYMLLNKMSKFLTVRKAKILMKVVMILVLLASLDICIAVFSQIVSSIHVEY